MGIELIDEVIDYLHPAIEKNGMNLVVGERAGKATVKLLDVTDTSGNATGAAVSIGAVGFQCRVRS